MGSWPRSTRALLPSPHCSFCHTPPPNERNPKPKQKPGRKRSSNEAREGRRGQGAQQVGESMASTVLRASAFRRAVSTATSSAPSGLQGVAVALSPPHCRSLLHSSTEGGHLEKIEQLQRQIREVEDLVQQNVNDFLELYKEMRTGDRSYFERFLTKCGISRSKFRDDFVWSSKLATLFVASGVVAYLLPEV